MRRTVRFVARATVDIVSNVPETGNPQHDHITARKQTEELLRDMAMCLHGEAYCDDHEIIDFRKLEVIDDNEVVE